MEFNCLVNKKSVRRNKALKLAQKSAKKYYPRRGLDKGPGTTRAKIRKLADLNKVECKWMSDKDASRTTELISITREQLIELCKAAVLTGRSGNGFSVATKLEAFSSQGGTLIINGVECDPGLVTDSWLYKNKSDMIMQGAEILEQALGLSRVVLATKEPLKSVYSLEQKCVIDRFPMGYENYLIQYVTGVELKPDELPQDRNILVMNLQTVIAIAELVQSTDFAKSKYITVANHITGKAIVVRVNIGDSISSVVEQCFTKRELNEGTIYAGGGVFTVHEAGADEIILDTTGYIALGQMPDFSSAGRCKGCGACTKNCPAQVSVHKLVQYVEKNGMNDASGCKEFNPSACIGCGTCTYGCLAGKDVRRVVMWAKMQ